MRARLQDPKIATSSEDQKMLLVSAWYL
jgi:hypothetical protein